MRLTDSLITGFLCVAVTLSGGRQAGKSKGRSVACPDPQPQGKKVSAGWAEQSFQCVILLFTLPELANAQPLANLTTIRDSSYTLTTASNSIKKQHPTARLVTEQPHAAVRKKTGIEYCRIGKRKLVLDVFSRTTKLTVTNPAILIIHGAGWRSGDRSQHHALAQRLAQMGYVCFIPEYRLSTEALYPAAVHDLKAALRWMHRYAKTYAIDTTRIAVMGFSAGGQLAALLGTTIGKKDFEGSGCSNAYSSNVQAIVDLDGTLSFVHPESGEGDDSKKVSAASLWFGYSKTDSAELWKEASPLTHVGAATPPTLFINSGVARMHAGREDFMKVLRENNVYTDVKTFEDAPHHFVFFEPWFTPMVATIDAFLKRALKIF